MSSSRRNNFESLSDNESDLEMPSARKRSETSQILGDTNNSTANRVQARPKENLCFSTKTALIAIAVTISFSAVLVIIVDLTILEVEREARESIGTEWNIKRSEVAGLKGSKSEYTFTMNGSQDSDTMDIFHHIPKQWLLVYLKLSHVEVNPAVLSNQLEHVDRVKTIELINITMFGRMGVQRDIVIPSLQQYTLELNQKIGPKEELRLKNKNCSVADMNAALSFAGFQDKDCLRSLIFFSKSNMKNKWGIEQVHLLNATIKITLFGFHIFTIDPVEGELTTVLSYTQDILEDILSSGNSSFELKKLNLRSCPVKLSLLSRFANQLSQLQLLGVNFNESDSSLLSTTISQFKLLKRLRYSGNSPPVPIPSELERIDLSDITTNVRELRLGLVELDCKNTSMKFILDNLTLERIGIKNLDIIHKFHEIFDAKRMYWGGPIYSKLRFSRYELWANVLQMPSLKLVAFDFTIPDSADDHTREFRTRLPSTVLTMLDNIIKTTNVNINQPFIMKKNNITGNWEGKNLPTLAETEKLNFYFESGNVDETFTNVGTFIKLKFPNHSFEM